MKEIAIESKFVTQDKRGIISSIGKYLEANGLSVLDEYALTFSLSAENVNPKDNDISPYFGIFLLRIQIPSDVESYPQFRDRVDSLLKFEESVIPSTVRTRKTTVPIFLDPRKKKYWTERTKTLGDLNKYWIKIWGEQSEEVIERMKNGKKYNPFRREGMD